jgi:signal transduction histidine kinase
MIFAPATAIVQTMRPTRISQIYVLRTRVLGALIIFVSLAVLVLAVIEQRFSWLLVTLLGVAVVLFSLFWWSVRSRHSELERSKDEFVSLVSHQLRTPLTAMRLFSEMLLDDQVGPLNAKQHEYLRMIEISTVRMIDLVSDFLNTSRLELGHFEIKPQPAHLEDIVANSVNQLQPLASQARLTLNYDKPSLPAVPIEASLYGQIVNNLLSNAVHYTPEGGSITVKLSQNDEGYQLDITDSGIGIPLAARPNLFKRFYRADNAKQLIGEGSGLGLYLVKRIVDTCGGKIWYESAEGWGTTFHVIIPSSGMTALAGEN